MKRSALAFVLAVGIVAGLTAPAFAHATLESTSPGAGAVVTSSPGEVVLRFDEQVATSAQSVEVYNAGAKRVDSGGAHHVPGDSHSVEVAVPRSLAAGGYIVTWRVISADSHPVHGAFTFFVGSSAGGQGLAGETSSLLAASGGSKTVGIAFGVVRWLEFVAVALLVGGLLFAIAVWPGARTDPRARLVIVCGFFALVVSTAAAFALQGPYGAGLSLGTALRGSLLRSTWDTRFGHVYAVRLVLLIGSVVVVRGVLSNRILSRWFVALAGVLGVALLATWGFADHAATGAWVPIALPFDVVHIGAAAIWVGGLTMTSVAVLPASRSGPGPLRQALPRFSEWAFGAVVAIAITGVFAAWRQVGISWGALTTTPYGRLVIYKSVAFAALLLVASASRTAVHGRLALPFQSRPAPAPRVSVGPGAMALDSDRQIAARLRVLVVSELIITLAVLGLTSWLVEAQPADQAYAAPFSTQVKAGPDFVNVVIQPAKAGPLVMHMYILTGDGAQAAVPEVDATMSNAGSGIAGLTVPLVNAGPGHFLTNGFVLPIRGTWTLQVIVRTDAVDEYYAQAIKVHIH